MPLFEIFSGWYAKMYLNDHEPMHFHAVKADTEVKIFFEDFTIVLVRGKISPAEQRKLLEHTKERENELTNFWNKIHNK